MLKAVGVFIVAWMIFAVAFAGPEISAGTPVPGADWIVPETDLRLIWIDAGTFTMGSENVPPAMLVPEYPPVRVKLTQGYWIGEVTVTRSHWHALFEDGGEEEALEGEAGRMPKQVGWDEALEFCLKLTGRESRAVRLPEGYHYRMPTEAEWEHAARAGTETDYFFTDAPASPIPPPGLDDYVWHRGNSGGEVHPVGLKNPNPWGLYDIYGNVWEWCMDVFPRYADHAGYNRLYGARADGLAEVADPPGHRDRDIQGYHHMRRGGAAESSAMNVRSALRMGSRGGGDFGFRLVLGPEVDLTHFDHTRSGEP